MSTQLAESQTSTGHDDNYLHLWCCDEDLGYCGKDLTGMPYSDDDDIPEDPLCTLAEELGECCPICGIPYNQDI